MKRYERILETCSRGQDHCQFGPGGDMLAKPIAKGICINSGIRYRDAVLW